jgi:hypothetical protein
MASVEPHPTDEGKFQSAVDNYGHGPGNGKSRSAVYKHLKSLNSAEPETQPPPEEADFVQSNESEFPVETEEVEVEQTEEAVDYSEDPEWGHVEWPDDTESAPTPRTIPKAVSDLARGKAKIADAKATKTIVRFTYHTLDRALTHWGRGVMNDPSWDIVRAPEDMDTLEVATMGVLDHYGVSIPMSPVAVWGAALGSAYVPPLVHIRKHADPTRKKRNWFAFLRRFRRKKVEKKEVAQVEQPES